MRDLGGVKASSKIQNIHFTSYKMTGTTELQRVVCTRNHSLERFGQHAKNVRSADVDCNKQMNVNILQQN